MASLQQIEQDGLTILKLHGSLTSDELDKVENRFETATQVPGVRAVVDLTDVEMVTTPALSMFIAAANAAKQSGGRIVFTESTPPVRDVLKRLRLHRVLKTVTGLDAAISQARE